MYRNYYAISAMHVNNGKNFRLLTNTKKYLNYFMMLKQNVFLKYMSCN